jgi:two-component system sensor histidine kinase UhpB
MSQPSDSGNPETFELMAKPQAIHAALDGMVTIDAQMRIIMINPAALRMFGRTAANTVGLPVGELMPQRFRELHEVYLQRFFDSDQVERPIGQGNQLVGLRANGEEFPLKAAICKVALETQSGLQQCCTATFYDCSEEQALSNVIEPPSRQMRAVFELAPVAIWITDGDLIAFANRACSRLFGVDSLDTLVGRSILELMHVDAHNSGFEWSQVGPAHDEDLAMLNGKITRLDGSHREVEIAITPLPEHGQQFVQMVIVDATLRSKERRSLMHSKETLRALAASIVEAREEERQLIARELHDELGQRLTALKMELAASAQSIAKGKGKASDRTQHMIDMVDETMKATRRLAIGLRPPMLDDLGLDAAIDWLVSEFRNHHPIQVDLRLEAFHAPLSPAVSISLYRILQEALTNIARHSGAQRVHIELSLRGPWIQLVVQDDGKGLSEPGSSMNRGSFGLIGMRERVRMLSGQLELKNGVGGGARLKVRLPLTEIDGAQLRLPISESAPPPDSEFTPLTFW